MKRILAAILIPLGIFAAAGTVVASAATTTAAIVAHAPKTHYYD